MTPEQVKDKYEPRIRAILEKIRSAATMIGATADEIYDLTADEYQWNVYVRSAEQARRNVDDQGVDFTFTIIESEQRDGEENGVNFMLDVTAYGGEMLGCCMSSAGGRVMTTTEARDDLTRAVVKSARDNDGWPGEADASVNNASRRVVEAVRDEHGEAWLGKINLYGAERHGGHPIMWEWDGSLVYNFGAAFVAPGFDAELVRLIEERDAAPYTGTTDDAKRVDGVFSRLQEIGGVHLFWT